MTASAPTRWSVARLRHAALLAAALAILLPQAAHADLVGHVEERAAVAGVSDEALIDANPLLEGLRSAHPEVLSTIIERLRGPVHSYRRGLSDDKLEAEHEIDDAVLADNPDLAQLYRESPEAALDLLRLIREAAKAQ